VFAHSLVEVLLTAEVVASGAALIAVVVAGWTHP
jgi:hypothetical protein